MKSVDLIEPKVKGNRPKNPNLRRGPKSFANLGKGRTGLKISDQTMKRVAEEVVLGHRSKMAAAKELGITRSTLYSGLSRPEIKEHLLRVASYNAEKIVPVAMENVGKYVEKLNNGQGLTDKEMDIGYKATQDSLKMGGLLNTGGDSYHLTQIYHDQKVLISPAIQSLLDEHSKKFNFSDEEIKLIEDATGTYSQGTEERK